MTRRERQRDELRQLCHSGALARAIGLAFEHFADFGPDADYLRLLTDAVEHWDAPADIRRRFAELRASIGSADLSGSQLPSDD